MSVVQSDQPWLGVPMTWEEFSAHEPPPSSEYIDGRMIAVPPPTGLHQRIVLNLVFALRAVVPKGIDVMTGSGWKPTSDAFIPDVVVHLEGDQQAAVRFAGCELTVVLPELFD